MMLILQKHAAKPEGTTTIKYDSKNGRAYMYRKMGGKWVYVKGQHTSGAQSREKEIRHHFRKIGDFPAVGEVLRENNIHTAADLREYVRTHSRDTAAGMFRQAADRMKNASGEVGARAGMKEFGHLMMLVTREEKPKKKKLTVSTSSKKGSEYRVPVDKVKPVGTDSFPASVVKAADKALGTWSPAKSMPTTKEIKAMVNSGNAKVIKGSLNEKGTWKLPKRIRGDGRKQHVIIPFRPDEKGIRVTLQQIKTNKKRESVVAAVQVTIPYSHAEKFLSAHIDSARFKNDRIAEMKRSAGYKNAIAIKSDSQKRAS